MNRKTSDFLPLVIMVCLLCRPLSVLSQESTQCFKITFLSWLTGSSKLSYEVASLPGHTEELTVGRISWGHDHYANHPKGMTVRYAHKYVFGADGRQLTGPYIRPELVWSRYAYDSAAPSADSPLAVPSVNASASRATSQMGALFVTGGYEGVWHHLVFDGFVGLGPSIGNRADTYYQHGFVTWHFLGTENPHLALTFGMKVGVAF